MYISELHYTMFQLTGTPLRSVARMQSNLRVHDMSGFPTDYRKFSNLVVPLFWAEYVSIITVNLFPFSYRKEAIDQN